MQYVDFSYYVEQYRGNKITDEEMFSGAAREASLYLREITHDRISEIIDNVKNATCAVAEVYFEEYAKLKKMGGREVKSENTDGYSISYVTEGKDGESRESVLHRKMYLAARKHLIHTGLLNLGWY